MIFYEVDGEFLVGTQADAKATQRPWKQVDVPTDKAGLMAFVNDLMKDRYVLDQDVGAGAPGDVIPNLHTAEHPDLGSNDGAVEPVPVAPPPPSYSERSIEIDEIFENLPIPHQLTLAALALENARKKYR